jgi:hypothetical protein
LASGTGVAGACPADGEGLGTGVGVGRNCSGGTSWICAEEAATSEGGDTFSAEEKCTESPSRVRRPTAMASGQCQRGRETSLNISSSSFTVFAKGRGVTNVSVRGLVAASGLEGLRDRVS